MTMQPRTVTRTTLPPSHLRLLLFVLAVLSLGSCARKQETTSVDSSRITDTATRMGSEDRSAMSGAMPGMKMTGKIDSDMIAMGTMMMGRLGAADSGYDDRFIQMMVP